MPRTKHTTKTNTANKSKRSRSNNTTCPRKKRKPRQGNVPEARTKTPRSWKQERIHALVRENEEIADLLRRRRQSEADPRTWVENNRWLEGRPWSYESSGPIIEYGDHDVPSDALRRPYLYQYVNDQCRDRSVIKCRQSEFTENQINENLFYALVHGAKISHIFPTDELGDSISNEKIKPAIDESPNIEKMLSGQGAVRRYQFRTGGIYTVHGALKRAGGRASSRDTLVFDEYDFMPSDIFGVYEQLLSHSSLHLIRKISTPTVPDVGIDAAVKDGCFFEWEVTCPDCGAKQIMTWPDNCINFFEGVSLEPDDPEYHKRLNQVYIGCRFCKAYLDRNSAHYLHSSRWVPRRPDLVGIRNSYSVTAAMIPWKTGKELLRRFHGLAAYEWQWWNEVFGLAYLKGESRLAESEILACTGRYYMTPARIPVLYNISIGVDWGKKQSWVVVSASGMDAQHPNRRCVVYVEEINEYTLKSHGYAGTTTDHADRVMELAHIFNADIIVNDANGIGIDRNQLLITNFPDRAWGCFFDTAEYGKNVRRSKKQIPEFSPGKRAITISKVYTIKALQLEFRNRQIEIPAQRGEYADTMRKFIRHSQNLATQPRWDEIYEQEYEIAVKIGAEDHFFDAHMYSKVGWDHLVGASGAGDGEEVVIF